MENLDWRCKSFQQLSNHELHRILKARQDVFVVEQQCIYLDIDGIDDQVLHLAAWKGECLVAYTRLLPPNVTYKQVSIGRVLVVESERGSGLAKTLMEQSIAECEKHFGKQAIKIGAQSYLEAFYSSLGFVKISDEYLEDGIPHIDMVRES